MLAFSFMKRLASLTLPILLPCAAALFCYLYAARLMGDKINCAYIDLISHDLLNCADGGVAIFAERLNWSAFLLLLIPVFFAGLMIYRKYELERDARQRDSVKILRT